MSGSRETLRATFDEDAELYARARPVCPDVLVEAIDRRLATAHPRTLEIGCGTGQATVALARRGHRVVAVELGGDLARVARRTLVAFPQVEVVHADIERWEPATAGFDLVVCATAFHWLDPATRFARVARLLRPGGLLALVQTLHVSGPSDAFFADLQSSCYARWMPDAPAHLPLVSISALPSRSAYGLEDAEEFTAPEMLRVPVDLSYDAERYVDLLRTFSNHRALPAARLDGLLACIRARIATERECPTNGVTGPLAPGVSRGKDQS
ncbi:class I SAM-dependent methyltransferase [Actinomycetospora sp. CA-084318]|uniref:class I SAM-dependent methyltransferase n=1 Tax=Actinomycetospora sp. CA-084318 TaxID=3239892 RepID=UPI003D961A11